MGEAKRTRDLRMQETAPQPVSRLQREREQSKARKLMRAAEMGRLESDGESVTYTVTPAEARNMLASSRYMHHVADYLTRMAAIGPTQPAQVKLADIPEDVVPDRRAIAARAERSLMMANVMATIDFLLGCPGDNIEICDGLWRIYEGLLHVEVTGKRFYAFEPDGNRATGSGDNPIHVMRKAAVSAAVTAYMRTGLNEKKALDKAMIYVDRVSPAHFGLPADKKLTVTVVQNWRDTLMKERSASAQGLKQFTDWTQQINSIGKTNPEHLEAWAERLLYAVVYRA